MSGEKVNLLAVFFFFEGMSVVFCAATQAPDLLFKAHREILRRNEALRTDYRLKKTLLPCRSFLTPFLYSSSRAGSNSSQVLAGYMCLCFSYHLLSTTLVRLGSSL